MEDKPVEGANISDESEEMHVKEWLILFNQTALHVLLLRSTDGSNIGIQIFVCLLLSNLYL